MPLSQLRLAAACHRSGHPGTSHHAPVTHVDRATGMSRVPTRAQSAAVVARTLASAVPCPPPPAPVQDVSERAVAALNARVALRTQQRLFCGRPPAAAAAAVVVEHPGLGVEHGNCRAAADARHQRSHRRPRGHGGGAHCSYHLSAPLFVPPIPVACMCSAHRAARTFRPDPVETASMALPTSQPSAANRERKGLHTTPGAMRCTYAPREEKHGRRRRGGEASSSRAGGGGRAPAPVGREARRRRGQGRRPAPRHGHEGALMQGDADPVGRRKPLISRAPVARPSA